MSEKFPRMESAEIPKEPPRWRVSEYDEAHPDSPLTKERNDEQAALDRTEQKLSLLDSRDPNKRHERQRLRERRIAIEAKRGLRELLQNGHATGDHDPETAAYLEEIRDLLNA